MKLLSISVNYPHTDGFSYQENLLPKYQKECGYNVYILASQYAYDEKGNIIKVNEKEYVDKHGIFVKRLAIKGRKKLDGRFKKFKGFYQSIKEIQPDVIFCHLFQFCDVVKIIRYKKENKNVKVYVDNHADFYNSASSWLSKNILHKIIWKYYAKKIEPYVEKFYGVTPARVEFLNKVYGLPLSKIELLPLGADDEAVKRAKDPIIVEKKHIEYGLKSKDFIIVTGGKIDHNKPQILLLMKAVNECDITNIKLLVFGSVAEEYKAEFEKQLSDRVRYIGWRRSEEIYAEFAVADLVVFPGLHSVLWEQAVGMGKPCIFRDIEGFHHIDLGGNCLFFKEDSIKNYQETICQAIKQLTEMKQVAEDKGRKEFSYLEIAKRSIRNTK